jgi:hypothetical protein
MHWVVLLLHNVLMKAPASGERPTFGMEVRMGIGVGGYGAQAVLLTTAVMLLLSMGRLWVR